MTSCEDKTVSAKVSVNAIYFVLYICLLLQTMTLVNRMTAYGFKSNTGSLDMSNKKQVPSIRSQLTSFLYFEPKDKTPGLLETSL